jgi:AcrR family transcriptional regulator
LNNSFNNKGINLRNKQMNQQARKNATEKILQAATAVFAAKGRAATMADIAAKAGVSQGLAYHYFTSKEEIFSILLKQAWAEAGGGPAQRIGQIQGTPSQRLTILLTYILEGIRQTPGISQIMYNALEDENTPPDLKALIQRNGKALQDIMRQFIIEGQAAGEIVNDDPDQLLVALLACVNGLMKRAMMLDPKDANSHFPDAKIILRMLKPENQEEKRK